MNRDETHALFAQGREAWNAWATAIDDGAPIRYLDPIASEAAMTIQLTAEHQAWLLEQVAEGRFASIDDAVAQAIDALRLDTGDDDDWVIPLLAEGEAQIARGETIPAETVFERLKHKFG
jgi:Arc/MetJ-type ribon-helix-helix transcriptional regulator